VIADWQGSHFDPDRHRTLMFEGHTDVVTEGDAKTWRYPPFAAEIVDGRIYGRGTADMKAGVIAAIVALEAVMKVCPDLAGRIRLGIVVDEEGMMSGIKHYIKQGWADEVDAAIICEPEENELCLFQKGALRVGVHFTGLMSHGAMPYAGINPIPWAASFIHKLAELEHAEQSRLGEHPYLGLPWLTPTIVQAPAQGEAQLNVMPASCYVALDIRTLPGQDHETLWQALEAIVQDIQGQNSRANIRLERIDERPWTETAKDEAVVQALERAYPLIFGTAARYGGVPGATDGTFLHAWAKLPIVTVGAGRRDIPHQKDEYIEIDELVQAAKLYAAAIIYYFNDS
jgi:succinyl-diaminopimelate desuccinylase